VCPRGYTTPIEV